MMRRVVSFVAAALALVCVVKTSHAQPLASLSVGATIPSGEFADYAETGWIATASVLAPVARPGLFLGARLFYGSNSHSDVDGDKTNLSGVLGSVLYRFRDRTVPGVFVFANVGMLRHAYSSDVLDLDESETGLAFGGGAGVSIPRGRMSFHATASYLTGSGDVEGTSIIPIQIGFSFPLTRSN